MEQDTCTPGSVSRRNFLNLTCGCSLAAATFGEAFANTDPIRVAQASGSAPGGKARVTFLAMPRSASTRPAGRRFTSIPG
jgi:hypothetical protein